MEFGEFIRTLLKGIRGGNQEVFVTSLFEAAGAYTLGIDTKIKNWMSGRNVGYRDCFVGIAFKDNEFVEFLRDRTNETWPNIQSEFKCKSGIVDCLTKNATVFFESVMNQFKDIVDYPYKKTLSLTMPMKSMISFKTKRRPSKCLRFLSWLYLIANLYLF